MRYLFLLILLFSLDTSAMETMKFELKNHDKDLILSLINKSQKEILVSKELSIGSAGDPCEITLSIIDENGQRFPLDIKIDFIIDRYIDKDIDEDNIILLKPGEYLEKKVNIERLVGEYSLTVGQYKVKAFYKNNYGADKGVFSDFLISNLVNIEVTETDVKNSKEVDGFFLDFR